MPVPTFCPVINWITWCFQKGKKPRTKINKFCSGKENIAGKNSGYEILLRLRVSWIPKVIILERALVSLGYYETPNNPYDNHHHNEANPKEKKNEFIFGKI